jgi:malonate transporter and related proteins
VTGILEGFIVIVVVIAVGYVLARRGTLTPQSQRVLSEVVFYVGAPALLFITLAGADVGAVVSSGLVVTAISSTVMAVTYAVVAGGIWQRGAADTTIGAIASSYVNAGNLGIPVAVYVLGSAEYVAPVMLWQLVAIAPVAFAVLDASALGRRPPIGRVLSRPLQNPVTVSSGLGLLFAAMGWQLPSIVSRPIELIGGMAVPAALIAFGVSLHGAPMPGSASNRRDVALVVMLKNFAQPLVAYTVGRFALGLEDTLLLAVTVTNALPSAQHVFVYAVRYDRALALARDAVSVTTVLAAPVLLVITWLLAT